MPLTLSQLTPDRVVAVRDDYTAKKLLRAICADHGISRGTAYECFAGGPREDGVRMFPPLPLRDPSRRKGKWPADEKSQGVKRAKLVRRMWGAAERQVRQIETRLALDAIEPAEREREARTFAVLVKTLRDLTDLDAARGKRAAKNADNARAGATAEVNYDDPRQIDDFRRELARRIEAIKAGGDSEPAGDA